MLITARDVSQAATRLHRWKKRSPPPMVGPLPKHYDDICEQLGHLRRDVQRGHGEGMSPPRVLVDGDTSGTMDTIFLLAGADIATCGVGVAPTQQVPHFDGDVGLIQDRGWDLVISLQPGGCLTEGKLDGSMDEAAILKQQEESASVFLRRCHADAPYWAVQHPRMERNGRHLVGMQPTQVVHPWEHEHDSNGWPKASELYLFGGLPLLRPTSVVDAHLWTEEDDAGLPEDLQTTATRSSIGVAGAMVLQWTPILRTLHRKRPVKKGAAATARDLIQRTTVASSQKMSEVVFYRVGPAGVDFYGGRRETEGEHRLEMVRGARDKDRGDVTPGSTAIRVAREELTLRISWARALRTQALRFPRRTLCGDTRPTKTSTRKHIGTRRVA